MGGPDRRDEASEEGVVVSVRPWGEVRGVVGELRVETWRPLAADGARGASLRTLEEPLDGDVRTAHFVASVGGRVVGAARLTLDYLPGSVLERVAGAREAGSALITRLVVHPGAQRRGIGGVLCGACIDRARGAGQWRVWMEASPASLAMSLRLRFVVVGEYTETEAIFVRQHLTIVCKELR